MSTVGNFYAKYGSQAAAEGINLNSIKKTVLEIALESRKQFDIENLKGLYDWNPKSTIITYDEFLDYTENGAEYRVLELKYLSLTFESEDETFVQYLYDNGKHFEVLGNHTTDHQWASDVVANWDHIPFWLFGGCRKEIADSLDIGMSEAFHAVFDLVVEKSALPGKPPVI